MAEDRPILHHYPRSPFSEKVRLTFGLKKLGWSSVLQPRLAPKPDLVALTGGYRRIPVLQIGADIYCDTRCILAEIERVKPSPSLHPPGSEGLARMVAGFADRFLFADALGLVFALHGDRFPPELHADRARFTAGRFDGWDPERMREKLFSLRLQFRQHRAWLAAMLADGRPYLLGDAVSIADLAAYHPLWYARENLDAAETGIEAGSGLDLWMARLRGFGHGEETALSGAAALDLARAAEPRVLSGNGPAHPLRGRRVRVVPDDWGFDPVEGELASLDETEIVVAREDASVGRVQVHFPHDGFIVTGL